MSNNILGNDVSTFRFRLKFANISLFFRKGCMLTMMLGLMAVIALSGTVAFGEDAAQFLAGKPVWPKDREKEMNLLVGFNAEWDSPVQQQEPKGKTMLRVAAATIYRAWLNGEFLGCGPARGPHGYYHVDEWDLGAKLKPGKNILAIEVAGYNVNSYALLDQPSFLQAEVVSGDNVIASTSGKGQPFAARILTERVQKVPRYSFQRAFTEVYRLNADSDAWRKQTSAPGQSAELAIQPEKHLLPRRVHYPDFTLYPPLKCLTNGEIDPIAKPANPWKDRSMTGIGPKYKGYPENELVVTPSIEMQQYQSKKTAAVDQAYDKAAPLALAAKHYAIFDLGVNHTGFLKAKVTCAEKTRLWFLFDEILTNDDVDFKRMGCINLISYELEPGTYSLESMEPNTLRYLKLLCMDGACQISDVALREYAHPAVKATFNCSDERLNRIFAAGVETFRQNCLDIFMDCPSRERAGWLCDSFFTSRAANDLAGNSLVERNFLECFCLPEKFEFLPDGMLPMCYPADHHDGVFIPNWALWFVIELEEYHNRAGDPALIAALQPKVLKLLDFFKKYENSDGLLEKLPSWVFVEWSAANHFVQDVNYPSNMLYAGVLDAVARMYNLPDLAAKASRIRDTIRKQSFDGQFFVDNAVRKDGKLEITKNRTEVCQYFAFFFHVATPETYPELWATLQDKFGPSRKETKAYPEIHQANSFIGNMLRMELLSDVGHSQQILDESAAYLLYMVDRTGTLWENIDVSGSCDHGFASHIVHTLYRDVLGVRSVDPLHHKIAIQINDVSLDFCEGTVPTVGGDIHLRWWKDGNAIRYHLDAPKDYQVSIQAKTAKTLIAQ